MLGLRDQVEVLRGRAEEMHGRPTFEVVTARAVAPLERLARWCLPLVAPGGRAGRDEGVRRRRRSPRPAPAAEAGCAPPVLVELGRGDLERAEWVVRVARPEPGPVGWRAPRLRCRTGAALHRAPEKARRAVNDRRDSAGRGAGRRPQELSTGLGWPDERAPPQDEPVFPQATRRQAAQTPGDRFHVKHGAGGRRRVRTAGELSDLPPSFDDETTPLARAAEHSVLARLGARNRVAMPRPRPPAWWWWPTRRAASARPPRRSTSRPPSPSSASGCWWWTWTPRATPRPPSGRTTTVGSPRRTTPSSRRGARRGREAGHRRQPVGRARDHRPGRRGDRAGEPGGPREPTREGAGRPPRDRQRRRGPARTASTTSSSTVRRRWDCSPSTRWWRGRR